MPKKDTILPDSTTRQMGDQIVAKIGDEWMMLTVDKVVEERGRPVIDGPLVWTDDRGYPLDELAHEPTSYLELSHGSIGARLETLAKRGREIAQLEGGEIEVREEEDSGTLETTIFVRVWQQPRQPFDPLALAAFYIEEESEPAPARSKPEEDDLGLEIGGVP